MNGSMIQPILLIFISNQMVLMPTKSGKKWAANGTISRSGAIWRGMSGKATTI